MNGDERDRLQRSLSALADGDRSAFEPTFALVLEPVRGFLGRQASSADVDDLVQETLVAVFTRASAFDPARDALAWILGIAAWQVRTARTRRRRQRLEPAGETLAVVPAGGPSPEDSAITRDLESALGRTLAELEPADAEALLAWAGVRNRPDVPAATFRKRVERALLRARSAWKARYGHG